MLRLSLAVIRMDRIGEGAHQRDNERYEESERQRYQIEMVWGRYRGCRGGLDEGR